MGTLLIVIGIGFLMGGCAGVFVDEGIAAIGAMMLVGGVMIMYKANKKVVAAGQAKRER